MAQVDLRTTELDSPFKELGNRENGASRYGAVSGKGFVPIIDLVLPVVRVSPDTTVREVKELIENDEPISAVAVVRNEKAVGLVTSLQLNRTLSHIFGVSLYHGKAVASVMDPSPLIVEGDTPIQIVAGLAMRRDKPKIFDHILVSQNGMLAGIVPVPKILETLAILEQERVRELSNITQRLQEEIAERKETLDALLDSRGTLQSVIDSYPHSIFWKDEDFIYLGCNRNFAREAGFNSPEDIIGRNDPELGWNQEDLALFQELDHRALASRTPQDFTMKRSSTDGSAAYFKLKRIPLYDSKRTVMGVLGINEDITEKKLAEMNKKNLDAQLRRAEKMNLIGTLAGSVAHDLNNILSGLVSYPELMLMDLPPDSPLRKPLGIIKSSGEMAAAIVKDLLTLARRALPVTEVVNLNEVITGYMKSPELEHLSRFHPGSRLEVDLEEGLPYVSGSPTHLFKTVMNLVSNAFEAMPDCGTVRIKTENRFIDRPLGKYEKVKEGHYVVLTVADTGIGISEDDIMRIFEPFYTKKVMGKSGTGLGMAVVWSTVKDHNGYIDVESRLGQGTTFTLYIPVTHEEPKNHHQTVPLGSYMGKGESILIVDDVELQRKVAVSALAKLGYSVTAVSSGEDACEYLKQNSADLIVLDMIMEPGMDGLETYEKILDLHPSQKAIIASGFSESHRVKRAQELGAGQYIRKPYSLKQIAFAVRQELDR